MRIRLTSDQLVNSNVNQFNSFQKYSSLAIKAKILLVFLQRADAGFQDNQILLGRNKYISHIHTYIHIYTCPSRLWVCISTYSVPYTKCRIRPNPSQRF